MHECEEIKAHCEICGLGYASKAKSIYCRRLHPVGSTPASIAAGTSARLAIPPPENIVQENGHHEL